MDKLTPRSAHNLKWLCENQKDKLSNAETKIKFGNYTLKEAIFLILQNEFKHLYHPADGTSKETQTGYFIHKNEFLNSIFTYLLKKKNEKTK